MSDLYSIDSHKLIYHPQRVADWLKGRDIYPIYVELAPYGGCNHRCIFCALDYLKYRPNLLATRVIKRFLRDISAGGTKSIMFAGEGEPLLHRDFAELVRYAKKCGLDVAITSNGVLLKKAVLEKILPCLSWLRISLNAATAKTYSLVHRTHPRDFQQVIENIKKAVNLRRKKKYACVIGAQLLLLNENYTEISKLAKILKRAGADYLIIKPYSQHPASINRLKADLDYGKFLALEKKLKSYEDRHFKIVFRKGTMLKIKEIKLYRQCLGLPFWAYLASNGDLYACSSFLGDKRFCYGNIYRHSFDKIWHSQKRKRMMKMVQHKWDISQCRDICRLDEINRYLWELKRPLPHVNFI